MIHLVHRNETPPFLRRNGETFIAKAACGQKRGFGRETDECRCVTDDFATEIQCGRCLRIYRHWKRVNERVAEPPALTLPVHGDMMTAMEWGFRAAEKGWNIDRAIEIFRRIISADGKWEPDERH